MNKITLLIVIVVVAVGSFYAGTKFGGGDNQEARLSGNYQDMTDEERQEMMGQMRGRGGMMQGMAAGGEFVNGEVISVEDGMVTVELHDGGSKIVFVCDDIRITKMAEGVLSDLKEGDNIVISGQSNSDGSVTAETLQIVPEMRQEEIL